MQEEDALPPEVEKALLTASPEIQALFPHESQDTAFVHAPQAVNAGLLRGQRACGCKVAGVFGSGHTGSSPCLDRLVEQEEAREFASAPHHGELRAEAQDKFIAAMTRRGIKVPLSMLLS
jgi:hypothetical protein